MNIKSIDEDGKFFTHTGEFRLNHHQRGEILEPGVTYQIKPDEWLRKQTVLEETDNPFKPAAKPAKPKAE